MSKSLTHCFKIIGQKTVIIIIFGAILFWWGMFGLIDVNITVPSWQFLLMIILVYPIIEELAFRGFIQESLQSYWNKKRLIASISLANIATSILFTALHVVAFDNWWLLSVIIPSLIFGYLKDKCHHILPSICLHIYYNAGYFFCAWLVA